MVDMPQRGDGRGSDDSEAITSGHGRRPQRTPRLLTVENPQTGRRVSGNLQTPRKVWDCAVCYRDIEPGEQCFYVTAFFPFRICLGCAETVSGPYPPR